MALMREQDSAIALALQRALLYLEEAEYLDEERRQRWRDELST